METGHPSTRAVNSGSGNRALAYFWKDTLSFKFLISTTAKFTRFLVHYEAANEEEDGDADSSQLLDPSCHRQRHWNKILDYRPSAVTCSDHVMPAGQQLCNVVGAQRHLASDWRRDLKLLGGEASLTRSFDWDYACAQKVRQSLFPVTSPVPRPWMARWHHGRHGDWQYCLSRMTTDYLHLSVPSNQRHCRRVYV